MKLTYFRSTIFIYKLTKLTKVITMKNNSIKSNPDIIISTNYIIIESSQQTETLNTHVSKTVISCIQNLLMGK